MDKEYKVEDTSQTPRSRMISQSKERKEERGKERENSISVMDLWRIKDEKEENRKRMRKEKETETTEIFKKSNKNGKDTTKQGGGGKRGKGRGEEEDIKEERAMYLVLEEIKKIRIEMVSGREEVKSEIKSLESRIARMEEGWKVREQKK